MQILHWAENCTREEMPPQWMWPFPDVLEEHFDNVEANREDHMRNPTSQDEPVG